MNRSAPGTSIASFQLDVRTRLFRDLLRVRLWLSPGLAGLALVLAVWDPAPWRRILLACLTAALVGVSVLELRRLRSQGIEALSLPFNLVFVASGQLVFVFCSGGVGSPVLPALVVFALGSALFAAPPLPLRIALLLQVPSLWAMAALFANGSVPHMVPVPLDGLLGDGRGPGPWVAAALYSVMLAVAPLLGARLRAAFAEEHSRALSEREMRLQSYAEQSASLTRLTAEIAHELKNPLASVKGLAALVARDTEGRAAERAAVLRGEVDRMQRVLEEFLNFSRPLVPLDREEVDLVALTQDVVALHEGMARERGVRLVLQPQGAAGAPVRCDPRKLRQLLVNLLQNALDAARTTVTVTLDATDDVRVSVADDGAGLDPEVRERLFEPGVTHKPSGSGMGLSVARMLARQHGGELTLEDGPHGGAVARLHLPHRAPQEAP